MAILNVDHPDVQEFIWCKSKEERKARVLRDAGFDMDLDGSDSFSIQYQNANNSVRVTDEFMRAVVDDADWDLVAVTTGEVMKTVRARDLWREIAQAAWECADPGLQFDTTINALAHRPRHRAHQRLQPVLGVHAPGRLGVQPRVASTCCRYLDEDGHFDVDGLPPHRRGRVHGPGDPRRQRRLPDAGHRRDEPRLPPARPRLRQPRRHAHGSRPPVRQRGRPGLGRGRSPH